MDIPYRSPGIPKAFEKLWSSGKRLHHVVCTGNLCTERVFDYLRGLATESFHVVQGDYDKLWCHDDSLKLPESKVFRVDNWSIGLIHGHQILPRGNPDALAMYIREWNDDVDLLISGYTYQPHVQVMDQTIFVNPGSTTGSLRFPDQNEAIPSFILLDIDKDSLVVYTYRWIDDDIHIQKQEMIKPRSNISSYSFFVRFPFFLPFASSLCFILYTRTREQRIFSID